MRRFSFSFALLLVSTLAHAVAPGGKALTAGEKLTESFMGKEGVTDQRRHAFQARRGQEVTFSAQWTSHESDLEGNTFDTLTHGLFWVEDASGKRLEGRRDSRSLKFFLTVVLPSDGPWFLVSQAPAKSTYELEMFAPKDAQVARLNEQVGAGIIASEKYFAVPITREQEGKRVLLSLYGEREKLSVALMQTPGGEPLACEEGPCTTRDFIWKAKAGTAYLRVTPEEATGCVLALHVIPADTERIVVGRAIEGSLGGESARRSLLLNSAGGELGITLTATGFEGRLEVSDLLKPASTLPAEFLDGRARIPFSKGSWLLTVSAKSGPAKSASFRLEVAVPKPGPSTADLLGTAAKEPVGGNVAFIDLSRTLAELPEGKAALARLKVMYEAAQKQLDEKKAEVQSKKGEDQKQAYAAFETLGRDLQVRLSSENDKATAPLVEKLGRAVRKLREERGVTVFDASAVAWADNAVSLAPAVTRAVTGGAAGPKEPVRAFKVAMVELQRVNAMSKVARDAQARIIAVEHYLARAEAAEKEQAAFQQAMGSEIEKLAMERGFALVLLKEGVDVQYPGLVWKTPPVDLTADVVKALDAK